MKNLTSYSLHKQHGLSMVELMVSLVVSSLLMLGVFEIFLSTNQNSQYAHAYARLQENGRLALDILTRNVRMTGYQSCIDTSGDYKLSYDLTDQTPLLNDPDEDTPADWLTGYEIDSAAWTDTRNAHLDPISDIPAGSDVIYVQFVSTDWVNATATEDNIALDNNGINLAQYDLGVISDCQTAEMFRVSNDLTATLNITPNTDLLKAYSTLENTRISRFNALAYYVKDSGREDEQGNTIFSLYQFDSTATDALGNIVGREDELIEGVDQLQILYGQELSTGNLRFVDADDATLNPQEIKAVKISLLLSSTESIRNGNDLDNNTYPLNNVFVAPVGTVGAAVTHPVDRRIRQTFSTTIKLRNL